VSEYWLARCEGFHVRSGRRRGVVEDVAFEAEPHRTAYIVVRYGLFRRSLVPPEAVETVTPADKLLVLRSRERRELLAPALRRAGSGAGHATHATARAAVSSAAASSHALRRASGTGWSGTRRFAGWLAPRIARMGRAAGRGALVVAVWTALGLALLGYVARVIVRSTVSMVAALVRTGREGGKRLARRRHLMHARRRAGRAIELATSRDASRVTGARPRRPRVRDADDDRARPRRRPAA
jgi:hypothetical protein